MIPDLQTTYLGLRLRTPLVASASPLTGDLAMLRALEAAGAAAVVLPSLFEEQITHESVELNRMTGSGSSTPAAADGYFPALDQYNTGPTRYLRHLEAAKSRLGVPVIASLNGSAPGGWVRFARMLQDAGADAVELNVYRIAADPDVSAREVEQDCVRLVAAVREVVVIPLAVKLSPFFTAFANLASRLVDAGADGLVLFNRFYQPDLDPVTRQAELRLVLSTSDQLLLALRWLGILHGRIDASLAATGGVHTVEDAVKALLVGADAVMLASALLRHGPDHLTSLENGLADWLAEHGHASVDGLRGSASQAGPADASAYERATYLHTLTENATALRP